MIYYINVRAPVIYAGFGGEFVGWRVVLQRRLASGGSWKTFDRSPIQLGIAQTDTPARLHPTTVPVRSKYRHDVRARVRLVWYGYGSDGYPDRDDVIGRALHEVDWYRHIYRDEKYGPNVVTLRNACPDYHYGHV